MGTGHNNFGVLFSRPSDHGDRRLRLRVRKGEGMLYGRRPLPESHSAVSYAK